MNIKKKKNSLFFCEGCENSIGNLPIYHNSLFQNEWLEVAIACEEEGLCTPSYPGYTLPANTLNTLSVSQHSSMSCYTVIERTGEQSKSFVSISFSPLKKILQFIDVRRNEMAKLYTYLKLLFCKTYVINNFTRVPGSSWCLCLLLECWCLISCADTCRYLIYSTVI